MSGIYLHIPFCKQACFYCDFHFSTSLKKKDALLACLKKELIIRKNELKDDRVETIYFGGGTPSVLSTEELNGLIDTIYSHYQVVENPEITLEANPDDLSNNKIIDLANSAINRLSIGVQSFFDEDLQIMNRAHTATEALNSLRFAKTYFDNISVDLIYGIPNLSTEKWKQNLQIAFDAEVNHISSYALTVEPKTALDQFIKQGKYLPLDEDLAKEHFDILVSQTQQHNFVQYEISNFGKPTYFSKHNTSYWLGKKYLGIGPSAHSFKGTHRSWNISNNTRYIKSIEQGLLPQGTEALSVNDRFNESVMTGLRTIWGVSLDQIELDFGSKYREKLERAAEKFISEKLLSLSLSNTSDFQKDTLTLKTTEKGKFLADGIASALFII